VGGTILQGQASGEMERNCIQLIIYILYNFPEVLGESSERVRDWMRDI
jgi:hypothetical protein